MKYFYLLIIAFFLCHSAYAANVEDKSLKALPPEIEKAIHGSGTSYDMANCKLVGTPLLLPGDKTRSTYFVTVESRCLGSAAGQIFIVDLTGNVPSVIMRGAAYSLGFGKERHHGLNDLKIFIGNAGSASVEYWIFNGKKFVRDEKRSWDFPSDCSKQSGNPENPFDCNNKK